LQPSDYEAHRYLGDVVEEIDKALSFVNGLDVEGFSSDTKVIYAVEKAIQNAI